MSDETTAKKAFTRKDMCDTLADLATICEKAKTAQDWQNVLEILATCQAFARKARATCTKAEAL